MKKGELIIIPTDTVYGLCAKLYDEEGLNNIYKLKSRDFNKQIPILVGNINQVNNIGVLSTDIKKVMAKFWPGPLTIVFSSTKDFYNKTHEKTIAIRMPNHKLALKILNELGPLRVTSVNKSNEPPILDYKEIYTKYNGVISQIYEQNEEQSNLSSTVVDMTNNIKILRVGAISEAEILEVIQE